MAVAVVWEGSVVQQRHGPQPAVPAQNLEVPVAVQDWDADSQCDGGDQAVTEVAHRLTRPSARALQVRGAERVHDRCERDNLE